MNEEMKKLLLSGIDPARRGNIADLLSLGGEGLDVLISEARNQTPFEFAETMRAAFRILTEVERRRPADGDPNSNVGIILMLGYNAVLEGLVEAAKQ